MTSPGRCRSDDIPLNRTGAAHVVPGAGPRPLYYFSADSGSGMAKGQGVKAFGSDWYVVNAKGSKIDDD